MIKIASSNSVALAWKTKQITYAELQKLVSSTAKLIASLPQPIFINLPKSDSQIVWLLACLKTETPFCLLDVENQQRNSSILRQVPYGSWVSADQILQLPEHTMHGQYIVFTSGTTGEPKGVVCYQDSLVEVIESQAKRLGRIGRCGWYLNPAFDASLSDILLPLLTGGTLYIPDFPTTNIKSLKQHLQASSIEYTDLPPRYLNILSPNDCPKLKTLLVGGEPAAQEATENWRHSVSLWNSYGPTEATVSTSMCQISKPWEKPWLGQVLEGVEYNIMNGELIIAGHLAKEYIGQEKLTAERFKIYHGKRYYHTGDIVGDDNGIFYVGRKDRQLKINGILICPEEIEKYLSPIDCVVFKNNGRLTIATTNKAETLKKLETAKFPRGKIVELSSFPRTISGKPDIQKIKEQLT